MTVVARHHAHARSESDTRPTLLRKRRAKPTQASVPLGVDQSTIVSAEGTVPLDEFGSLNGSGFVVLTRREADLVAFANPGVRPPVALEVAYPWLPEQFYLDDARASHAATATLLARYCGHLVNPAAFCDERWNTVCNALRRKNGLDARFRHAWHLPIQDVFVLEEDRPGRVVIALDFNGMYAACMQQDFPKPSALRSVRLDRAHEPGEPLPLGLYRCVLEGASTDFIRRHNPFRSLFAGRRLRTCLDEAVEVDLNEFELAWVGRHFDRIHLVEAVVADVVVPHPLAREAKRCFARRLNYHAQGNKTLADREKFLATLLSSCAARPRRERKRFASRGEAMEHLRSVHGIVPSDEEPDAAVDAWLLRNRAVELREERGAAELTAPSLDDGSACFMLGQRIVARGRTVLLEMMERVLSLSPNVRLCYANIDSIHLSVAADDAGGVLTTLRSWSRDVLGSFKIETVTRHGLWLEPGRYWLYSDGVEKFRNRSVGDRRLPFRDHAVHVASRRIGDLHVPIRMTLRMDRTMSDARSLHQAVDGSVEQRMVEVSAGSRYAAVLDALDDNRAHYTPARMAAFRRLAERMRDNAL